MIYILWKYSGTGNMNISKFNPIKKCDVCLVQLYKCGRFPVDSIQRTQTTSPLFAGKKGSLWSSKDRTLAWWPGQLGHSDQGWPRKARSNWLGAGEYQELARIPLLGSDTADLAEVPDVLPGKSTWLPHLWSSPTTGLLLLFQRELKKQLRFIGCFRNDQQINANFFFS